MPNNKEKLVNRILAVEWDMFSNVSNAGGPAPCQDDRVTFENNRYSQAMTWSPETLQSYLNDLIDAQKDERNLMTEKYARMMESTHPEEFENIKSRLPPLDPEVTRLVEDIIKIELQWQDEIKRKYPHILKRGRPVHSSEDTGYLTSFETYLRGELSTYSVKTLKLYYNNILKQDSENLNGAETALEYLLQRYGYQSAAEANQKMGSSS